MKQRSDDRRAAGPPFARALTGLIITIAFFGLVETLLLFFGVPPANESPGIVGVYGASSPLFVEDRRDAGRILATATNKLRFFNWQSFPRRKEQGVTRIFCLGGSTTYGHPFRDPVSFPGWMRELLREAAPERSWEVINAGGISYASHRELDVLKEVLRYEPDIIVVLNGHNEFLEERTYRDQRQRSPLVNVLHEKALGTRLYTAMDRLRQRIRKETGGSREVHTRLDDSVGLDAYTRDDAAAQAIVSAYADNMRAMAHLARQAGVRMLWVEPASQLRGCAPFKSEGIAATAEASLDELRIETLRDPRQAHNLYRLAEMLARAGREAEALPFYIASRDEDIVPLRATSSILDAFHRVACEEAIPVLPLAQLCAEWTRQRSGSSIPGPELLTDHVHFTMEGYRLIAAALIDQLNRLGWLNPPVPLPDSLIESVAARVEAAQDRRAQGDAFKNLAKTLSWAGKTAEAARLAEHAIGLFGEDAECRFIQALEAADQRDWAAAEALYRKALSVERNFTKAWQNLGVALSRQGRYEEAADAYRDVIRQNPLHANAHYNLALVLHRLNQLDDARAHMSRACELDPQDHDAREALAEWSR